jgi:hypothetical protein
LGDLSGLELTARTVQGPVRFKAEGVKGDRSLILELPRKCTGELVLRADENVGLRQLDAPSPKGYVRYALNTGKPIAFQLKHT